MTASIHNPSPAPGLDPGRIVLAPMEGVLDHTLRALLTELGGIDRCVTEFVRVTRQRLPRRAFLRLCPELESGGRTPSGVPVHVQLLGGQPGPMADNAAKAAELGALGIDLNFGCPAKTVNRHDGGSVLLREPERVHALVATVRAAVPAAIPVSAKIRLGFEDSSLLLDVARGVQAAGADELAVHARTRTDGYRPPAHWHEVAAVREALSMPVLINGEIWSESDARRAQLESGCHDLMLGRGVLARPDLPRRLGSAMTRTMTGTMSESFSETIAGPRSGPVVEPLPWPAVVGLLRQLFEATLTHYPARYAGNPVKQWLGYLRRGYGEADRLFEAIKRLREVAALRAALQHEGETQQVRAA